MAIASGAKREIACFGARGDGKSWGALWGIIMHAAEHHAKGFALPTIWLGVRDTLQNHKLTTLKSLREPAWEGRWQVSDGGHTATYVVEGVTLVQLELVGVDSPGDAEKVRTQCHGVWFDEAAPAMDLSNGLDDSTWFMALSSQRLETHARVGVLTTNLPDEEHWTWERFIRQRADGTMAFRIPAGERASAEYRAELDRMYATRPDLHRRLVQGLPGVVMLGQQVAVGFDLDTHVARQRLAPDRYAPLWFGQDGGHTPTTVIGQRIKGRVHILGALSSEHAGMRQHLRDLVLPWLGEHAPWALGDRERVRVRYDPALDTDEQADIESNPLRVMRSMLPGHYRAGPVSWDGRKDPMLAALNAMAGGAPILQLDPDHCRGLSKALGGGWYYPTGLSGAVSRDLPKKPNHPHEDYGDAFCYLIAGIAPLREPDTRPRQTHATTTWSVLDHNRPGRGGAAASMLS